MALSLQGQSWGLLDGWIYVLAEGKVWRLISGNPKKQNLVDAKPVEAFEM